jgi:bacterioferritin
MGTKAREIVGKGVDELITLLNKAYADEWLAHYQYWVGAQIVRGPMRPDVQKELSEHADDEKKHAGMLCDRIIKLGGKPILHIKDLEKHANCPYDEPKNEHVLKIIAQNIEGEQCAIVVYRNILEKARELKDPVTFHIIRSILEDEISHEQDLQDLEADIKSK